MNVGSCKSSNSRSAILQLCAMSRDLSDEQSHTDDILEILQEAFLVLVGGLGFHHGNLLDLTLPRAKNHMRDSKIIVGCPPLVHATTSNLSESPINLPAR